MTRKGNLSAALSQFDKRPNARAEDVEQPAHSSSRQTAPVREKKAEPVPVSQAKTALPPSRQGKKALTGYFEPEVLKQLKVMAASEDTTIQALLTEALNDLFKKYGKPHIA
ncbi:ribbon-helix-helix domain-containing protein [Thiocystis violacea]|uniref:ribbon-helix-helix domain-containing protein n=1 Tax=Thiocystis violacea TaxID=13725 RepID=UPI001908D655|nr:ribbon-helix-helix domain-containing protein [Thiocystis violacea]